MNLHGIIPHILREHVEQAAFQWSQLRMLANAYPADRVAIDHVNARLTANLDAILIAGKAAWPILLDQFEDYPEMGELFVAAHLALALGEARHIDHCLSMAQQEFEARAGLAGALQRLPTTASGSIVRRMLQSPSPVIRAVALDVLAHHRADAEGLLVSSLRDPSPILRASACALAAATGRSDCVGLIVELAATEDPDLRFAAISALATLRDEAAPAALKAEIASGPHSEEALRQLQKFLPAAEFLSYLGILYQDEHRRTLAVRGIGMTGDRNRLALLIEQMAGPVTAIAAGESFLELFPEAAATADLFTMDVASLGPAFENESGPLPVASKVSIWARANNLLV